MTKTDLRDDASLAAMRLEWWPPSNWNGGRDAIGIGGRLRRNPHEQGRSALDQGVRPHNQGRDRSLRLSVREALTGPGAHLQANVRMPAHQTAVVRFQL